ncbi:MAG: septum formation family protein [Rhodoglobus sp.]
MTEDAADPGNHLESTAYGEGEPGADDEVVEAELVDDDEDANGFASDDHSASRSPLSRVARRVMWAAGVVVASLLLVVLFFVGTRIAAPPAALPVPTSTPTASPAPTPAAPTVGPVAEGVHQWDALRGGECLDPFDTAWQDSYTVVNCAAPHVAQLVIRGAFADAPEVAYPGLDQLSARMNLLCTAPSVVDYSAAGGISDIQVEASFAVDAADWDAGNRTYFCFLSRSSGESLLTSIAIPQP